MLGPGLLESVYEVCLCHELSKRGIPFQRQLELPVVYDGVRVDAGLRLDLLVSERVIAELKSVERRSRCTIPVSDLSEVDSPATGHSDQLQRPAN